MGQMEVCFGWVSFDLGRIRDDKTGFGFKETVHSSCWNPNQLHKPLKPFQSRFHSFRLGIPYWLVAYIGFLQVATLRWEELKKNIIDSTKALEIILIYVWWILMLPQEKKKPKHDLEYFAFMMTLQGWSIHSRCKGNWFQSNLNWFLHPECALTYTTHGDMLWADICKHGLCTLCTLLDKQISCVI